MRRCRFFFNVFGLELPDYLSCHQFSDSNNPEICVGQKQMRDVYNRALKPGDHRTNTYQKEKNKSKTSIDIDVSSPQKLLVLCLPFTSICQH